MPTAFAHALAGGALALAMPETLRSRRLVLGFAAVAVLPDADVAGFWFGVPYDHPLGHRGFSHSLLFAALIGLAAALILRSGGPLLARALLGCGVAAATVSHGVLDAFTDGGLGIGFWLPFSNERVFAPFRPVMTSSLDPTNAFGARGLRVLANEALWIGLPATLFAGSLWLARSATQRRDT